MVKVYAGFLSTGNRSAEQVHMLRQIEEKYKDKVKLVYPEKCVFRIFHDFARNSVVEEFLKSDCDILWFLDSDISPAENVFDLITEHGDKWKLAGCPYPVFIPQPGHQANQVVFCVYKGINEGKGLGACDVPKSGTEFIDGIATGCLFIKREVFNNIDKPYFKFVFNEYDRRLEIGEDLDFCKRVVKLGYKFFVDYSIVAKHFKTVDLLEVNNYAIEMSNKSVIAYDQMLRSNIAKKTMYQKFGRKAESSTAPLIGKGEKTPNLSGL